MRLVLTRAEEDATRTRDNLETAGHEVIVSPVIEIVALSARWPTGAIDAVVAASGQAFRALTPPSLPSPEARRLLPLHLVGLRTAAIAAACGFAGPSVVAANAARLVDMIATASPHRRSFVYLAGRHRKKDIELTFARSNRSLHVLEVYEARAMTRLSEAAESAWRGAAPEGILHYSRRSAELLIAQMERSDLDARPLLHFCLSEDTAIPLREAGCSRIAVADAPNERALLALLSQA